MTDKHPSHDEFSKLVRDRLDEAGVTDEIPTTRTFPDR